VLAAVFASFLGIRKKAAGERDATSIKPLHVVVAGLLGAAILAALVLSLVRFITHPN
jgi:ABC-type Zn2+ transport system substrate-binding protein/surface adhesin